jgi:hypothetical protein
MNEREKITLSEMLFIYCRAKHNSKPGNKLCPECSELESYAHKRLEHCTFGEEKPICKKCTIHCYKNDYRVQIKRIMRFSGPRMFLYHPLKTIKHLIHNWL